MQLRGSGIFFSDTFALFTWKTLEALQIEYLINIENTFSYKQQSYQISTCEIQKECVWKNFWEENLFKQKWKFSFSLVVYLSEKNYFWNISKFTFTCWCVKKKIVIEYFSPRIRFIPNCVFVQSACWRGKGNQ